VLTLTLGTRAVRQVAWTPAVIRGGVPIPLTGSAASRARARFAAGRGCTDLSATPR
jgi:poly-gamma-glutamate synthesis protein (capsule biosynthesis protein)